ncbi:hypothetical protein [Streptomyces sp. MBT62]|uniref:hypothetical protein n=1 Tax=Streptomyces sp. MBT62 TaxID=2800410 RepID=UPI00190AA7E5|nr:hypothetical protein [Streptomyces sp. MBT62]MBK3566724.1 hypothetical protein [Streptomyces sp. MBT62]
MTDEELRFATAGGCAKGCADDSDGGSPVVRARARLRELAVQLRDDVVWLADTRAQALFSTTANLLVELDRAFAEVDARAAESAWSG